MLNLIDNYMQRINGKVPDSCLRLLRDELSELLMHYTIQPVSTELTVYEGYIPQCFAAYCVTKKIEGASDETMCNYMMRLKEFFRQMDKPLEDITANDVRVFLYTYQKEHHICNRTLDSIRSVLGSFFSWASGEGYIQKNVMLVVKPIKYEKREREALTEYELELLRAACHTLRDEAMVEVLYSTGCRVTELVRLDLADVSFEKGEVMLFGKGSKHRKSYLTAHAMLALKKYLDSRTDDSPALFVKERIPNTRMSKAGIEKVIGQLGKKAGIQRRVYPHLIRHTTATMALRHGMDVTEIQQILGHANVATTMIYAKVDQSNIKQSHKKYIA